MGGITFDPRVAVLGALAIGVGVWITVGSKKVKIPVDAPGGEGKEPEEWVCYELLSW